MKANGTKRKIFNDAVDLLAGAEEVSAPENGIRMLPIDSIRPFRSHPFRLYEGGVWRTWWRALGSMAF